MREKNMRIRAEESKLGSRSRSACAGLAILIYLSIAPHIALAQQIDACAQELCLYGNLGTGGEDPACVAAKQAYSSIRSFDALGAYDPVTTALERDTELHACPDFANELVKQEITGKLGQLFTVN
jgi:hypothetical protein